jgi:hypothetical protein
MYLAQSIGDEAAADRQLTTLRSLAPMFGDAVINRIRHLDTIDKEKASALFNDEFETVFNRLRQVPNSPILKNQLAWLAGRCGRRLDTAETQSRASLENRTQHAAYLDTLAEILAARGDADASRNLMEQAVAASQGESLAIHLRRTREMHERLAE